MTHQHHPEKDELVRVLEIVAKLLEAMQLGPKLDAISDQINRVHHSEMRKIDRETDALAEEIRSLGDVGNAEQAARLQALAARLNAMGKVPDPET